MQAMAMVGMQVESALDGVREAERHGPADHRDRTYASSLGHPCMRHMVYERTHPYEAQPMDVDSLWRLSEGRQLEARASIDLTRAGWQLEENQRQFVWPKYMISGKIDGMLRIPNDPMVRALIPEEVGRLPKAPVEIKTINPLFWDKMKTIGDIRESRYWWIRKYPSQLNVYMLMAGIPIGFLMLLTFGKRPRLIPMAIDYDLGEADLQMVEKANEHVLAGTLPEPIPFDGSVCGMCDWSHICQPLQATIFEGLTTDDIPELERYLELKKAKADFDDYHEKLIGTNKKPGKYHGRNAIIEGIQIISNTQSRTSYDVPKNIQAKYAKKTDIVITKIERVGDKVKA